jgi:DNA-directed RNA polymerase I, II, and III subunit RPABC1
LENEKNMEKVALNTITTILNNRGYMVVEHHENKLLAENFQNSKILVILSDEEKVNMNTIKEIILVMNTHSFQHTILIYKDVITPSAKKIIESLPDLCIELFSMDELQYNLVEHYLVPHHEKLEEEEASVIRKKWGSKLPILLKTDAVSRYYNFQRGDIIKVTRSTEIVYRIVR